MKKILSYFTLTLLCAQIAGAQVVFYITSETGTVRRSTDGGASWSNWLTGGSQRAGIAVDQATGTVFVADRGAGSTTARPLYAYSPTGTLLDTTFFDDTASFNRRPVTMFNNFVYVNAGQAGGMAGQATGYTTWTGTAFSTSGGPVNNATAGSWQGNDMITASAGGTDYLFMNGTSGTNLRRWPIGMSGTLGAFTGITLSGTTAQTHDMFFTPSGRLLVVNSDGFWLSASGNTSSTSITLSNVYSFTGTETPAAGDLGPNGRDFVLIGDKLYAVTNQNFYEFDFDDTLGTISFSGLTSAHGYNSNNLHLAYWIIPEPAQLVVAAVALALAVGVVLRTRERRSGTSGQ